MHVAVLIVTFRNPTDTVRCLQALSLSDYPGFEVVICENGGEEAYAELLTRIPEILPSGQNVRVILAPSNLGYAGGVNTCMAHAQGADAWWVLNPDAAPHADALGALVDRLERGDCEAVGSVIYTSTGTIQSVGGLWRRSLARAVSLGHGRPLEELNAIAPSTEGRLNYLSGASMLVTPAFVARAGLMREDYFLYCEEVEWCLRAREMGAKLGIAQAALILHQQGTSTGNPHHFKSRGRLAVHLGERNRLLLTRDRYPTLLAVAAPAAFLLIWMRFARRGAWRQLAYALSGWWDGLLNKRGEPNWNTAAERRN